MDASNKTFDPQTIADDLLEVRRIYSEFFVNIKEADWDKPVKGGLKEWNLHDAIAHLCALNGDGRESIKHTLRGEPYTFFGLEHRYKFNDYNREGIHAHQRLPRVDGAGAGEWYLQLSPDATTSGEGSVKSPGLMVYLRETAVFCQMLTGRFNLPIALISGAMKLPATCAYS